MPKTYLEFEKALVLNGPPIQWPDALKSMWK
jgi:hypothetical protein